MQKHLILILLVLVIGLPIFAGQLLPWWAVVIVLGFEIVLIAAFAPRLIGHYIGQRLTREFEEASKVLANAQVEIHAMSYEPEEEHPDHPLLVMDLTLTPSPGHESEVYNATSLLLAPADATISATEDSATEDQIGELVRVLPPEGIDPQTFTETSLTGPQRLRLKFDVGPDLTGEAVFRYYLAQFGRFQLPPQ